METGLHIFASLPERNEPGSLFRLRRRWYDEIEAVGELLVDNYRSGEQTALSVDFRPDVFADARPPNLTLRDQGGCLLPLVQVLLEREPLRKSLQHVQALYRKSRSMSSRDRPKFRRLWRR